MSAASAQKAGEEALEEYLLGEDCSCPTCLTRVVLEAAEPHLVEPATPVADTSAKLVGCEELELPLDEAVLVEPCPECVCGKCGNCDGGSWDLRGDRPAPCPCSQQGHPRRTA